MAAPGKPAAHVPLPAGIFGAHPEGAYPHFRVLDAEALRDAIRQGVAQLGRSPRRAHLALDGMLIRTMVLPIPFTPPRGELELAIRSEAERYRIFEGSEVACDFAILNSDDNGLSVLVAAAQRAELDAIVGAFAAEGLTLDRIEPAALAGFRGVADEVPRDGGLIMAFPSQLHVLRQRAGKLVSWRALVVSEERLRRGEPALVAETTRDVLRSLHDLGDAACLLAGVPEALRLELREQGGLSAQVCAAGSDAGGFALAGALRLPQDAGEFAFDLLEDRLKPAKKPVSTPVGFLALFGGVLIAALLANLWLGDRVKAREAELETLQSEMAAVQAQLSRPDPGRASRETLRAGQLRSASAAELLRCFQDATPHDAWLSHAELTSESAVNLEGYALSRQSPLRMAEALREAPFLAGVEVPQVTETTLEGQRVYRFQIQAVFNPEGVR